MDGPVGDPCPVLPLPLMLPAGLSLGSLGNSSNSGRSRPPPPLLLLPSPTILQQQERTLRSSPRRIQRLGHVSRRPGSACLRPGVPSTVGLLARTAAGNVRSGSSRTRSSRRSYNGGGAGTGSDSGHSPVPAHFRSVACMKGLLPLYLGSPDISSPSRPPWPLRRTTSNPDRPNVPIGATPRNSRSLHASLMATPTKPLQRKHVISSPDTLFDFEIFQQKQTPRTSAPRETPRNEQLVAEGLPRSSVVLGSPFDEVGDVSSKRFSLFAGTGDGRSVSSAGRSDRRKEAAHQAQTLRPCSDLNIVSWLDESSDDEFSSRSPSPCSSSASSRRNAVGVSIELASTASSARPTLVDVFSSRRSYASDERKTYETDITEPDTSAPNTPLLSLPPPPSTPPPPPRTPPPSPDHSFLHLDSADDDTSNTYTYMASCDSSLVGLGRDMPVTPPHTPRRLTSPLSCSTSSSRRSVPTERSGLARILSMLENAVAAFPATMLRADSKVVQLIRVYAATPHVIDDLHAFSPAASPRSSPCAGIGAGDGLHLQLPMRASGGAPPDASYIRRLGTIFGCSSAFGCGSGPGFAFAGRQLQPPVSDALLSGVYGHVQGLRFLDALAESGLPSTPCAGLTPRGAPARQAVYCPHNALVERTRKLRLGLLQCLQRLVGSITDERCPVNDFLLGSLKLNVELIDELCHIPRRGSSSTSASTTFSSLSAGNSLVG